MLPFSPGTQPCRIAENAPAPPPARITIGDHFGSLRMVGSDLVKIFFGLIVSIALVYLIKWLA